MNGCHQDSLIWVQRLKQRCLRKWKSEAVSHSFPRSVKLLIRYWGGGARAKRKPRSDKGMLVVSKRLFADVTVECKQPILFVPPVVKNTQVPWRCSTIKVKMLWSLPTEYGLTLLESQ
jgi:hypothetical protein